MLTKAGVKSFSPCRCCIYQVYVPGGCQSRGSAPLPGCGHRFSPCMCHIPGGCQSKGCGSSHCHTSLEFEYFPLSNPHTDLILDCRYLDGGLRKDSSDQNQHYTGPLDGGGWVGLLYRGWTPFGRGSRLCRRGRNFQQEGRGGGDGLSANPRNVTVI